MRRFRRLGTLLGPGAPARLMLLTAALCALWAAQSAQKTPLSAEESRLYHKVESAQAFLWDALERGGISPDVKADPYRSGFIGVEWSVTTTTLGSLEAKRCATDPLWAVRALRWFDAQGLREGDRIAVLASSSFPGLLYSVLAAAEARGLRVGLAVSLGSSTWGANRPEAPWPVLAGMLRRGGFLGLDAKPAFYTLGGEEENGLGMPEEARALLAEAARSDGVELFRNATLDEAIDRKMRLIGGDGSEAPAKLVVSVGGAEGNIGTDPAAMSLVPGVLAPGEGPHAGNGVIGMALRAGRPVLYLLNLRVLAEAEGIGWEERRPEFAARGSVVASVLGLALFALVMATHRRWTWEPGEEGSTEL